MKRRTLEAAQDCRISPIPFVMNGRILITVTALLAGLAILMLSSGCQPVEVEASELSRFNRRGARSELRTDSHVRKEPIRPLIAPDHLSHSKILLGKKLFHDVRLSADNTISCASCHQVKNGGDDGQTVSTGIGGQKGILNAPTVLNSGLSVAQFWDGRADSLYEQVSGPIHNPIEMGSNWKEVLSKLKKDRKLVHQFRQAYNDEITVENITNAIATYEEALVTVDSPFDRYLRGDDDAVSQDVLDGYALFKSTGCISCHQGQAVGGNMFQEFGVMEDVFSEQEKLQHSDKGRINVTKRTVDLHRFKVPSLRNVARTAPYFHDGRTANLADAIRVMAKHQLGEKLDDDSVLKIEAFLKALNGKVPEALQ